MNPAAKMFVTIAHSNIDSWAVALIKHAENSTYGSNGKYYFHNSQSLGFNGNQYVSTVKLTELGGGLYKYTKPIGKYLGAANVLHGIYKDMKSYGNGVNTHGYNSIKAGSSWVTGYYGAIGGAKLGASIGSLFGGAGAIPGAIIGAALGGFVGALGASWLSDTTIDYLYGK